MNSDKIQTVFEKLLQTDEPESRYNKLVEALLEEGCEFVPIQGNDVNTSGSPKDNVDPISLLSEFPSNSYDSDPDASVNVLINGDSPQKGSDATHILVEDNAGGMSKEGLMKNFLRFGGTDKVEGDSTGTYGYGSLSAIAYTENIGMIVATYSEKDEVWYSSIVRTNDKHGGNREKLVYDGDPLQIESPLEVGSEIGEKEEGTVVKLFDYEFDESDYTTGVPSQEKIIKRLFGKELPNPIKPITIYDTRFNSGTREYEWEGALKFVNDNEGKFEMIDRTHTEFSFGKAVVTTALAKEESTDVDDVLYPSNSNRRVLVSIGGQKQAELTHNVLNFSSISERVFSIVQITDLSTKMWKFTSNDREGFKKKEHKEEVIEYISNSRVSEYDKEVEADSENSNNRTNHSVNSSNPTTETVNVFGSAIKTCPIGKSTTVDIHIENAEGPCRQSDLQYITPNSNLKGQITPKYQENKIEIEISYPNEKINYTDACDHIELTVCDTDLSITVNYVPSTKFDFNPDENFIQQTEYIINVLNTVDIDDLIPLRFEQDKLYVLKNLEDNYDSICHLTHKDDIVKRGFELTEFVCTDYSPLVSSCAEKYVSPSEQTKLYKDYMTLIDMEWHCGNCELEGSQSAKNSETLRKLGFKLSTGSSSDDEYCESKYCEYCESIETHRKLVAPFPTQSTSLRANMPDNFQKRVKSVLSGDEDVESFEIDHKRPHIRREDDEVIDFSSITDQEIKERFQLLRPDLNKVKREKCNTCVDTGERPEYDSRTNTAGTSKYLKGGKEYTEEVGCEGCPYHDVAKWEEEFIG